MLITKEVNLKTSSYKRTYHKYGIDISQEYMIVPIKYLKNGSHAEVECQCDFCPKKLNISYRGYLKNIKCDGFLYCKSCSIDIKREKTNLIRYGVKHYMQTQSFKDKSKISCQEKYGTDFYQNTDNYKQQIINTCLEKYGVENVAMLDDTQLKMKNTRILNGTEIPNYEKRDYEIYISKVKKITHISKKKLFKNWDGYDYYDGEYIKNYYELHHNDKKYPTVDHKISTFYGFLNNIPAEEIGNIENLCMTKRTINSAKNIKIEEEYKNLFIKMT